ncbi:MAG: hypothetical protein HY590_01060 [Candidatus Omnitrophica bacterium]|nr:hypothetical protein [Candidatus Omnitrophota bacterium]
MAGDPQKERRKKIIAVVLVCFFLPLLWYNVHRAQKSISPVPQTMPPQETPPSPASSEALTATELLTWKRDPFILGIGKEGELPTLQLKVSGIIYDETRPEATYAIINEEVVRIGDNLHGIKVIDIQPDYVRLKKFNQEVILYLYQEKVTGEEGE